MKVGIDKDIRIRARELSNQIQNLEREIAREIQKKHKPATKAMRNERDSLWSIEREMIEEISESFKNGNVTTGTEIRVVVQVGPNGGDILREHLGIVKNIHDKRKPCFNLLDSEYLNGKEFTIGSSCILEFEIL